MKSDISARLFDVLRRNRLRYIRFFSTVFGRLNLRLRNIQFGNNLAFFGHSYFYRMVDSKIKIGNNVVFRSDNNSNLISVTKRCIISTLAPNAVITIGNNSGFSGVTIGAAKRINIGSRVMVGANCVITDTNWHNIDPLSRHKADDSPGEIHICDNVFIGYGSIILKNVTIGENSVIGAGSVVSRSIPANVVAAGNPCVVVKHFCREKLDIA
jgi:acetyltransferase-like isoleucine patch superfamily enzyme